MVDPELAWKEEAAKSMVFPSLDRFVVKSCQSQKNGVGSLIQDVCRQENLSHKGQLARSA